MEGDLIIYRIYPFVYVVNADRKINLLFLIFETFYFCVF
jgi:hypothetical protein